jgi:hypothetical protein
VQHRKSLAQLFLNVIVLSHATPSFLWMYITTYRCLFELNRTRLQSCWYLIAKFRMEAGVKSKNREKGYKMVTLY